MGFYYKASTGLGKQTLGGHKQNLVCTRSQEEGAVTPQEIDPDLPVSVQESPMEEWVGSRLLQGSGCTGPFEGSHNYLHYLYHSLVSGQTGREQALTINRKLE